MAEQKIKFKVSIKELTFEFEGTREVGQALQTGLSRSLGSLLDTQRVAMASIPSGSASTPENNSTTFDTSESEDGVQNGEIEDVHTISGKPPAPAAEKAKRTRKSGGETAISLLRVLKAEGFFKEARDLDAIRKCLRDKGHNNPAGLSSRLQDMTKKGELYRQNTGDGFIYKDTPFNDTAATPATLIEPAE